MGWCHAVAMVAVVPLLGNCWVYPRPEDGRFSPVCHRCNTLMGSMERVEDFLAKGRGYNDTVLVNRYPIDSREVIAILVELL